jgi:hypothetical protein
MAVTTGEGTIAAAGRAEGDIYLHLALVCAVVAFVGFAPTYWLPLAAGTLKAPPIIHLHAAIFFLWSLFLVVQAWLAARRRIARHRAVGLIGVSLATAMTIFGIIAAINRMHWAASLGLAEAGRAFAVVPVGAILFFAVTFAFAAGQVRRMDWHKRLMLVAAISILDAPIARWFITFLAPPDLPPGPPPVAVDLGPSLVALLILLVAMLLDWRRRGRLHPAYAIGAGAYVLLKIVQVPLSQTQAWHAFAGWLMTLGA